MLMQLESTDVRSRRSIGRAAKERSEAPDVTNVVLLGMGAQATHEHVVLHALAKRRDWCIRSTG
ncbi:hypothetical protein X727_23215 [Mesorhizobium sp. L103C119B0]|nr:hypothetical protein X727_23215 [Mesorhizobium sp. L103C119B0]